MQWERLRSHYTYLLPSSSVTVRGVSYSGTFVAIYDCCSGFRMIWFWEPGALKTRLTLPWVRTLVAVIDCAHRKNNYQRNVWTASFVSNDLRTSWVELAPWELVHVRTCRCALAAVDDMAARKNRSWRGIWRNNASEGLLRVATFRSFSS